MGMRGCWRKSTKFFFGINSKGMRYKD
jgi:hypothetical protein